MIWALHLTCPEKQNRPNHNNKTEWVTAVHKRETEKLKGLTGYQKLWMIQKHKPVITKLKKH